ncbi:hypothetical protein BB561_003974 [Smittium simulii]|uniref:Prokaryotic-type class I peptide chain release factors domain-containing protein n=1 Tax=Smittium simulii TaxID=133385 RepID=A0A2T9YIS4_9FUNG|nr:hypothetical protein BB561_003974 [Smittium simulii]
MFHLVTISTFKKFFGLKTARFISNFDISLAQKLTCEDKYNLTKWRDSISPGKLDPKSYSMTYSRSGGPGGQNVNKLNTKAMLRMSVENQAWIPDYVKKNFVRLNKAKINKKGEYIITSEESRSQLLNSEDCIKRLCIMLKEASLFPKDPSLEKRERINKLVEIEQKRAKLRKTYHSQLKKSRKFKVDY